MAVTHRLPVKALSMGAAALVLGGTFATAPAITASPDSTFGFAQAAHAAEAQVSNVQVSWTKLPSATEGSTTGESAAVRITADIATGAVAGDTIPFTFGPAGLALGDMSNVKLVDSKSGAVVATAVRDSATTGHFVLTDFVNGKTGLTVTADINASLTAAGLANPTTFPITMSFAGTEYNSGTTYTFKVSNIVQFSQSFGLGPVSVNDNTGTNYGSAPGTEWWAQNANTLVDTFVIPDDAPEVFDAEAISQWTLTVGPAKDDAVAMPDAWRKGQWVETSPGHFELQMQGDSAVTGKGTTVLYPTVTVDVSADGKQAIRTVTFPDGANQSFTYAIKATLSPEKVAEGFATGLDQEYPIEWTSSTGASGTSVTRYSFDKGAGTGEFVTPTASLKAYAFDATGSGTTADGQNSDANDAPVYTLSNTGTIFLSAPNKDAIAVDQRIVQVDEAGNIIGEVASFTGVAPGETSTFTINAVDLPMGASTFYYKVLTSNPLNPDLKAEASDPVKIERQAIPTAAVDVTTYINGEDANSPVTLTPGEYEVTGTIANPNAYALTAANTTVEWVAVVDGVEQAPVAVTLPEGFNIPAGGEGAVPATAVELPKQGEVGGFYRVKVAQAYTLAAVLGGNGVATANAQDPAYAVALTGAITTNPDQTRVRVGEAFSIPLLDNDATDPAGHPLDPATIKLSATDGWVENEDGSFTNTELGITGTVENGNFVGTAGSVEGTFAAPNYTVENTLGDVSELTGITIEVYDYHVDLEALIGEEQQDADTKDDVYTITITDEAVETVTTPITLPVTNTGKEPITITGFQQVNTSEGGDGFEITLDEPVTLAPGESFTYTYDIELPVGEHVIDYKVLTAEGAVATDPVYVDVVKEIVPNEAPSHAVPELTIEPTPEATPETPVVEQEKPKAPTPVVPETGIKGATVEAKTADELAGSDAAVVASAQAAPAGFSAGKVVAGVLTALGALALAAWGAVTLRNRKAKDA